MARIEVYRDDQLVAEHDLKDASVALGRHRDNDIVLDDPTLSRFHARLEKRSKGYAVTDLSVNGVFVNGTRVKNEQELRSGDALAIGRHVVLYQESGGGAQDVSRTIPNTVAMESDDAPGHEPSTAFARPPRADEADITGEGGPERLLASASGAREIGSELSPDMELAVTGLTRKRTSVGPTLVVLNRGTEVERLPIDDELVIGRSSRADLHIAIVGLSRRHARLFREKDAVLIEDMGSQNGTWVNNKQIQGKKRLSHGDVVNFYEYSLVFLDTDTTAPVPIDASSLMPDKTPANAFPQRGGETDVELSSAPRTAADPAQIPPAAPLASLPSEERARELPKGFSTSDIPSDLGSFEREASSGAFVEPTMQDSNFLPPMPQAPIDTFGDTTSGDVRESTSGRPGWPSEASLQGCLVGRRPSKLRLEVRADDELIAEIPLKAGALRLGADTRCEIAVPPEFGLVPWQVTIVPTAGAVVCYRASSLARVVHDGQSIDFMVMELGATVDLGRVHVTLTKA